MARANFVNKAQKDIFTFGKRIEYVSAKGKREGQTLSKTDRTIPRDDNDTIFIAKGESYYWWQFQNSPKQYSKTRPRASQLTQSGYLSTLYGITEQIEDFSTDSTDELSDFVEEIAKITDHGGVGLVYDSVGKDTLEKSLDCLWPMGMCVTFGESSGNTEKLDLNRLVTNSLYLTRPTMALYKANQIELALSAAEVFAAAQKGILKPQITSYAFKDAKKAHQDLENRAKRGGSKVYYDRETHTASIKDHRDYKKELFSQGLIKKISTNEK